MTAYTVTGSATNNTSGGGQLLVQVLNNAALAVTPATGSSITGYNCSVTTTTTGSMVVGVISNLNDDNAFTQLANSTVTSTTDGTHDCIYGAFTSTLTVTPAPTSYGANNTFSGQYATIGMEILASGGVLSIDASSPAAVGNTSSTTFVTASFTPPAGSLLVALLCPDGNGTPATMVGTVFSTPALTWTENFRFSTTEGGVAGYAGIWTAQVPAAVPGSGPQVGRQLPNMPFTQVFSAGPMGRGHSY